MTESSSNDSEIDTLDALLSDESVETDVQTLSALGYETRYRLVRLLAASDGGLDFSEITPHVDVSDSAVSHAVTLGSSGRRNAGGHDTTGRRERRLRLSPSSTARDESR